MVNMEKRTAPIEEAAPSSGSDTRNNNDSNLKKDPGNVKENRLFFQGEMTLEGPRLQNQAAFLREKGGTEFEINVKRGANEKVNGNVLVIINDVDVVLESAGTENELLGALDSFYFSFTAIGNEKSSLSVDLSTDQARKLRNVLNGYLQAHEARVALEKPIEILVS